MAKSKFFRIAVEGATATDGRTIERAWIDQMAANYNPETYTARINCEHIRGFSPEPPFNAYGDVLALRAEDVEIEKAGKTVKCRALFGQIEPLDQLVAMNKKGQKKFTSCEVAPNFGDTKEAYLVGLAVTDNPASLGTEALAFSALKPMFDARKLAPENLFTAAEEFELELEPEGDSGNEVKGLVQLATEFFAGLKKQSDQPATPPVQQQAPQVPANDNLAGLGEMFTKFAASVEESTTKATDAVAKLTGRVDDLAGKLDTTEAPSKRRPLASGGGNYARTDC